jgi:hypothetical protein
MLRAPLRGDYIMIYKIPTSRPGFLSVVFELPSCVWADRIIVSGTFNNWNECEVPMRQDRDGVWRARLELPAGQRFEFRYLIDGRWQTDYHADGFTENGFGSHNSIVDLSLVMAQPVATRSGDQVPEGQAQAVPHLPASRNAALGTTRYLRPVASADMPRMRPRVAAA